jgi:hypothetical protein
VVEGRVLMTGEGSAGACIYPASTRIIISGVRMEFSEFESRARGRLAGGR